MSGAPSTSGLIPPPTEVNDTHKVYSIAIACIVLCVIASTFVLGRFYQRWRCRMFGADDYVMIPAFLFYLGWTAMAVYVNLHAGVGKPLWEITGIIGSAWMYPTMSALIRVSILLFYWRMFGKTMKVVNYSIWILLALQVVYVVVYSILPAFICKPLHMAWHPIERPKYFNNWYYYYLQVALYSTSMAFDWIILVLPVYPILKLQMPLKKRIGVATIFVLGAAASIVACYKLGIFVEQMTRFNDINPKWMDYEMSLLIPPQFDEYGKTFWIPSQLEPTVALIGTSLPALRTLFTKPETATKASYQYSGKTSTFKSNDKSMQSLNRHSGKFMNKGTFPGSESDEMGLRSDYVELSETSSLTK